MIASKILSALLVASVCSCVLGAGIYRAETKGGSHEQASEQSSGFASPVQIAAARKSAEQQSSLRRDETPKIEQQRQELAKPLERLEQVKQEEYRDEPVAAIKSAPSPVKSLQRKIPAAPIKTIQVRYEQQQEQRRTDEQQREYKQEKIDSLEQRFDEQQQIQVEEQQTRLEYPQLQAEVKGQRKIPSAAASPFAGIEQVRQEQEREPIQQPIGEPEPYQFSYQVDGSSRSEQGDNKGVVRGQYTLQGADGANRVVDYVADHNGFRATVNTNEFGTESKSPANVQLRTSQPLAEELAIRADSTRSVASLRPLRLEASSSSIKGGQRREETRYESIKGYQQQQQQELPKEAQWPAKGLSAELRVPQAPELAAPQEPSRASEDHVEQARYGKQQQQQQQLARSSSSLAAFESATAHDFERNIN